MSFLSALSKIGAGIGSFVGAPVIGIMNIATGKKSLGEGLAEAFIPGVATYNTLKDKSSVIETASADFSSSVGEDFRSYVWEGVGDLDLNGDGVTVADNLDKGASFVEDLYDVDIPYVGHESSDIESQDSKFFNFLGLVIPASVLGLIFLL